MDMVQTLAIRNRIRQFVDERGITVYRLIKDTGISNTTGYALANNPHQVPDAKTLNALQSVYRCSFDELLEYIPD
jgi:DNA-binding Xre family transcriptional regulator